MKHISFYGLIRTKLKIGGSLVYRVEVLNFDRSLTQLLGFLVYVLHLEILEQHI